MTLKSIIYSTDIIVNKKKSSHNQADRYYRCFLDYDGINIPVEFTEAQISIAIKRAKRYPEHFKYDSEPNFFRRWTDKIFKTDNLLNLAEAQKETVDKK